MNNRQTISYNMGSSTLQVLQDNQTTWDANTSVNGRVSQLEAHLINIETLNAAQEVPTEPSTINKRALRRDMATDGAFIAQGIVTYANDNSDPVLADEFDAYNYTYLHAQTAASAITRNKKVYDKANEAAIRPALIAQGYTDAIIDDYLAKWQAFKDAVPGPDAILAATTAATADLDEEVNLMEDLLDDELDPAMAVYAITAPDLYNAYKNARKKDNTGTRHVRIRAIVKEQNTGAVLPKVLATVLETGDTARSGKTGLLRLFSLDAGVYTLRFELDGYEVKTLQNVVVEPEGITDVVVELVKMPVG